MLVLRDVIKITMKRLLLDIHVDMNLHLNCKHFSIILVGFALLRSIVVFLFRKYTPCHNFLLLLIDLYG